MSEWPASGVGRLEYNMISIIIVWNGFLLLFNSSFIDNTNNTYKTDIDIDRPNILWLSQFCNFRGTVTTSGTHLFQGFWGEHIFALENNNLWSRVLFEVFLHPTLKIGIFKIFFDQHKLKLVKVLCFDILYIFHIFKYIV